MKSRWYVATLIMRTVINARPSDTPACDEQVRVLRASSADEAYEKAVELGRMEEHAYENTYGETVSWEFAGLVDLDEISARVIRDGTEIKSRIFEHRSPETLVSSKEQLAIYLS